MLSQAKWTELIRDDALKRSSLCVDVIDDNVYIFGGELEPRKPRDNSVHVFAIKKG